MISKLQGHYNEPKIFNNQYIVRNQISSGSFGTVYLVHDKITMEEFALKLEKEENEQIGSLDREVQVINNLKGISYVPKIIWYGYEQNYNVMIIQLLGKDLSHYMKQHKKFSLKSTLQIGIQMLQIMQNVHERGVVHRDLKPENILTGRGDQNNQIYLVDFGVSKIFLDRRRKHIPFNDKKSFVGTTRYASIAAHKGYEIGRKDDLESLFYVLIYLFKGSLPWQNLQIVQGPDRTMGVGQVKILTSLEKLCIQLPVEIFNILSYLKTLGFNDVPDYGLIKQNLEIAARVNHIQFDNVLDWTRKATDQLRTVQVKAKNLLILPVHQRNKSQHSSVVSNCSETNKASIQVYNSSNQSKDSQQFQKIVETKNNIISNVINNQNEDIIKNQIQDNSGNFSISHTQNKQKIQSPYLLIQQDQQNKLDNTINKLSSDNINFNTSNYKKDDSNNQDNNNQNKIQVLLPIDFDWNIDLDEYSDSITLNDKYMNLQKNILFCFNLQNTTKL